MISYSVMNTSLTRTEIENLPFHEFRILVELVQEAKKIEAERLLGDENAPT